MIRAVRILGCLILAVLVSSAAFAAGRSAPPENAGGGGAGSASLVTVAIYNDSINGHGSYFYGGDSNSWSEVQSILNSDPQGRFSTTVVTDLSATTLANFQVLSLPDNAVPDQWLPTVAAWFQAGHVIVCFDSAVSYAVYSGLFWPGYSGGVYYGTLWDYSSCDGDGQIAALDYITNGYTLGQAVSTIGGDAEYYSWMLPAGSNTFNVSGSGGGCEDLASTRQGIATPRPGAKAPEDGSSLVYGVYRDVAGQGRMVLLGPYDHPGYTEDAWPMIRGAHLVSSSSSYDLSFYDDYGRSQLCVNSTTGAFLYKILTGPHVGSYTGSAKVAKNSLYISVSAPTGSSGGTILWLYENLMTHSASGYYLNTPSGISSYLSDINTTNDPSCQ